ncbi:MAG: hypothetical protein OHK0039_13220 [Bacteroidia bacterium]
MTFPIPTPSTYLRGLAWLVAAILLGVLVLIGVVRLRKQQTYVYRATALLDRIEDIRELKLTTYYYEELITIGTRERVSKLVDHAREDLKHAEDALITAEYDLARAERWLDSLTRAYYELDTQLLETKSLLQQARTLYDAINRPLFADHLRTLAGADSLYGEQVQRFYRVYRAKNEALAAAKGFTKREARQERDLAEDKLRQAIEQTKLLRRNTRDYYLETFERQRAAQQDEARARHKRKDQAEDYYNQQRRAYEKALATAQKQRQTLAEAESNLEKARLAGEALEPKLLVVVPVEVTSYVDMRELQYRPLGGEAVPNSGDTLLVVLPRPRLDSVHVRLDSTANYNLGKLAGLSLTEDGFYYEVFKQLQDALREVRLRVRDKAIEDGILSETTRLAQDYVGDFAGSMGYKVQVVDSLGFAVDVRPTFLQDTLSIYDSTQGRLRPDQLGQ